MWTHSTAGPTSANFEDRMGTLGTESFFPGSSDVLLYTSS